MEGTEDPEGQRQKELMLRGESYDASCKLLVLEREKAHDTCFDFNNTRNEKDRLRIIRELKITFPEDSEPWIVPPFYCDYGYNIHLGKDVFINFNCVFLDVVKISLGDNCLMGPGVQMYTARHPLDYKLRSTFLEDAREITIGNDCWIGGSAVFCPGSSVGDRVVVGAGAVVTKNFPSDVVIAGTPATIIRHLDPPDSNQRKA
uniref:Maltose/galactoside acetyltransferase domain-containing protein n=1 Tax=Rhodosorus marinus TaxID=101924 RepID=A0A7S3A1R2_9RHOD|mmetsp:Transcript_40000/g.159118  ORF Transcript_40000/g.159118 Transcript_40000/m.159118 type:complete len:203 (+) Transcript_40000:328-936(+)|eukprot:CAMPEP_0113962482 /NCGR_PEP_ID=MMETSP0011_2-20120614/5941_1 /TAXON_ID=101924 /ORGANISM="Rhodosorus marinus" /LENGTH=202 /DNA_ID=CAMNT_0000974343 /DNA_START=257 /DNA_END=865 /DNA_ORIENTATION=+ /assembly_acc=CAM_ASM_000156